MKKALTTLALTLTLVACGSGSDSPTAPGPEPTAPTIAGTYAGSMAGAAPVADGSTMTLALDFALSIAQDGTRLSGGYNLSGNGRQDFPDGTRSTMSIGGGGTFTGTVTPAGAITVDFRTPGCPNRPNVWTGSAAPGSFTLNGTLEMLAATCLPVASFAAAVLFVQ